MFEIHVQAHFSSAHHLEGYDGDCSRSHGHNWLVEAVLGTRDLDATGIGIDFRDVKACLGKVLSKLDHRDLNDIPPFDRINPTSENIARYIFEKLTAEIAAVRGHAAKVSRAPARARPISSEIARLRYFTWRHGWQRREPGGPGRRSPWPTCRACTTTG